MQSSIELDPPLRSVEGASPAGDRAALARLRGWGGARLVHDLTRLFEKLAPARIALLRDALSAGDGEAVERTAHSLGSGCGQLGAVRLRRLALRLERRAAAGSLEDAEGLVDEIAAEHLRFVAWLETETGIELRVA